jgi:hypothetical protein
MCNGIGRKNAKAQKRSFGAFAFLRLAVAVP